MKTLGEVFNQRGELVMTLRAISIIGAGRRERSRHALIERIVTLVAAGIIADDLVAGLCRRRAPDGDRVRPAFRCRPRSSCRSAGYLVSTGRFDLVLVATAGAIGCNIGSTVAYAVGAYGGRPLVERWGYWVLIGARDLAFVDRFFARFGGITVFVSRLLPVVRTFIALPAGIARMPLVKFQIYTFLGLVAVVLCARLYRRASSARAGTADPRLREVMHRFDGVVIAAIVLGIAVYVWSHWQHRLRPKP